MMGLMGQVVPTSVPIEQNDGTAGEQEHERKNRAGGLLLFG